MKLPNLESLTIVFMKPQTQYSILTFHSDRLSASSTLTHPWLIQSALCTELHVTKSKLKRYVIKKRWAKAVSAVIALKRMGAKFEDHHDEKIEEKNGEN